MTSHANADVAVLIGRFQPFHSGHAKLLEMALAGATRVVIVLGSAFHARSPKNPFTWQERATMIGAALPHEQRDRVSFVAVRDYYEDPRWADAVQREVKKVAGDARRINLIGYFKDASSDYLNLFSNWQLTEAREAVAIDATRIRRIYFESENLDVSLAVLDGQTPLEIRQYMKAWSMLPYYEGLAKEHAALEVYRDEWKNSPYPPVFSTVDAVVVTADHVLLVMRGGFPGKGLWALPGGFLEPRERLLQGAIRELCEETKLAVLMSSLLAALVEVKVFDHPDRSQRGRTITHAHYFDLKTDALPDIEAADDAMRTMWVPISKVREMEELFFDDHFHILNHFLKLTDD